MIYMFAIFYVFWQHLILHLSITNPSLVIVMCTNKLLTHRLCSVYMLTVQCTISWQCTIQSLFHLQKEHDSVGHIQDMLILLLNIIMKLLPNLCRFLELNSWNFSRKLVKPFYHLSGLNHLFSQTCIYITWQPWSVGQKSRPVTKESGTQTGRLDQGILGQGT